MRHLSFFDAVDVTRSRTGRAALASFEVPDVSQRSIGSLETTSVDENNTSEDFGPFERSHQRFILGRERRSLAWLPVMALARTTMTTKTTTTQSQTDTAVIADPARVLAFDHVTKRYGKHTVVDDLSFDVQPGRVTGFLGPNGSGKSTTMKILLGLASADSGTATIGGAHYRDLPDPSGTVGAALETNAFHPGRSGRNHLRILADATGNSLDRVDETLELVGLSDAADRHAGAYSLGMRQRLGLAAALLGDPPILVLDEPANGLDPQGVITLRELLRGRAARGHTVLVSSHVLGEAEHLVDDDVVINHGAFVVAGSLGELQHSAAKVRTTDSAVLHRSIEAAGGIAEIRGSDTLIVRGLTLDQIGDLALSAGVAVHELTQSAGSLEELFLNWTNSSDGTSEGVIQL